MEKVIRYKCEYCNKEFKTPNRHYCKFNPKLKNCYSCENFEFWKNSYSYEDYGERCINIPSVVCKAGCEDVDVDILKECKYRLECPHWEQKIK